MDALLVTRPSRRAAVAAVVLSAAVSAARAQAPATVYQAGHLDPSVASPVAKARAIALQKLRTTRCQRVFADFRDLAGRPLDDVLAAANETPEGHLSRMIFLDGSGVPPCGAPRVFGFTNPGSLTVYMCPIFGELMRSSHGTGANVLIHEELHSLGAGEAPSPGLLTSYQITLSVEWRCGS
jgi:hypothetical protein